MPEEQRTNYVDLERRIEKLEESSEAVLVALIGTKDPLTGDYSGGMRAELGDVRFDMKTFKRQADNGGINAKAQWSFWQKMSIGVGPFIVGGGFAVAQSLIEKG